MGCVLDSILVRAQTLDAAGRCRPGMEVNALPPFSSYIAMHFCLLCFVLKATFVDLTLKQRKRCNVPTDGRSNPPSNHLVNFVVVICKNYVHIT